MGGGGVGALDKPLLEKFKWGTSGLGGVQGVERRARPLWVFNGALGFCV